jgi:MarR family transcriptional regulator, organic hydroperoxide resistance regulator
MERDFRELTAETDWAMRTFADRIQLSGNEFRVLLLVMRAEGRGVSLTAGELREQMGLSGAAITYLVERMCEEGYLRRESDADDRRKRRVRRTERGSDVTQAYFDRLDANVRAALTGLPDADLDAAHRVFAALVASARSFHDDSPSRRRSPAYPVAPTRAG